jgi:hypothetical protein
VFVVAGQGLPCPEARAQQAALSYMCIRGPASHLEVFGEGSGEGVFTKTSSPAALRPQYFIFRRPANISSSVLAFFMIL